MRSFRLGTLRPNGTVEPASPLAAEILAAIESGDEDRQRALLMLAARLDRERSTAARERRHNWPDW